MSGSFLDTTIVVHLSDPKSPHQSRSEKCVSVNLPSETPYYSLKELLAGHVQNLCTAHNAIFASQNHAEAMLSIAQRLAFAGRKKDATLQAIFDVLSSVFQQNPAGPRDQMKIEALEALAIRVNTLWRKAHNVKNVDIVQPLSCFDDCKIDNAPSGELVISTDNFNCNKKHRCAAAEYLFDDKVTLTKMIAALHPDNLNPIASSKVENASRRKALKDLEANGPAKFNKKGCRAIGDAYFAAMCPPSKVVITSNISDHLPLCLALGKTAIEP